MKPNGKFLLRKTAGAGRQGMTLVEVMITVVILGLVIVSILQAFVYFSILSNSAGNITVASAKAQSKMEEIRGHNFSTLTTDYGAGGTPGNIFLMTKASDGADGSGVIYIDTVQAGLLKITIVVSWRNKEGRIVGGDNGGGDSTKALNGVVDPDETVDVNGRFVSPMLTLVSYVAQRS